MKDRNKAPRIHPLEHKNVFSFYSAKFKATPTGMRFQTVSKHLNRFFRITRIFGYIKNIVIIIQTSTFFIIYATVFIVLIPILLVVLFVFFILSLFKHQKYNKIFLKKAEVSKFNVYFWNGNDVDLDSFLSEIRSEGQKNDITFIAYSNSFGQPLLGVKKESDSIYHISMAYFYSLKRKVLDKQKENTNYITQTNDTRE